MRADGPEGPAKESETDVTVRSRRRLALAAAAATVVALGVGVALATDGGDGAPDSVRIAGVEVGGKGRAEVERIARARARELMARPLEIMRTDDPDFRIRASRASLEARPRLRQAVEAALVERTIGGRLMSFVGLAGTRDIPLRFTLDRRAVQRLVNRVTRNVNRPARSATLEVTESDIALRPGAEGFGVDPAVLREQIRALPDTIAVTPGPLAPAVADDEAAAARERALGIVAQPVSVTLQGRGVEIEPAVLHSALRFTPDAPALRVGLDPDVLYEDIAAAFETRERPARDAGFRIAGSSVHLITSRVGRSLDMPAIAAAITAEPGTTSVRARFRVSRPTRTTAEVRALRITDEVSEFTTPYGCCEPRVTNIQRAAELLDGMIIPAGGRFSLNDALGRRTLERGFVAAPQIAAGRLEDAVGGGVSQVATTMYNAAFFGGMALIEHTPHQFWISRYPQGREATVSFGGPELVWDNDWDAGVLISAVATDNAITIRLFSSPLGRRVETETGEQRDIVEPTTHETVDADLEPGAREVEQEMGGSGFTISYTREVWAGDRLTRDEAFTWTYDPQDAFVTVGPDEPEQPSRPPGRRRPMEPQTPTGPSTTTTAPTTPPTTPTTTGAGASPPPPSP